jgi:hypothetical protein
MLIVPNVYATVLDEDECYDLGVNNGHGTAPFTTSAFRNCEKFNPTGDYDDNPYYKGFIKGCMDDGNTKETCETFTDN